MKYKWILVLFGILICYVVLNAEELRRKVVKIHLEKLSNQQLEQFYKLGLDITFRSHVENYIQSHESGVSVAGE